MKIDMGLRLHHTLLSSFDIVGHFILDRHLRRDAFFSVPHPCVCVLLVKLRPMNCGGGKFTDSPERLWGRKNAVNAITMGEAMKKEKEKKKMQMERREEKRRGRAGGRKRGKWQANRSYPKKDAVLDFWKATPER
jgi:hypothetical protein